VNKTSPVDDERRRKREERLARQVINHPGALWLQHELAHRQMSGRDLWERMLHFGTVGYSTVTAYTRGDIAITEKADLLARALGIDISEIHDAAAGRDPEGLSRAQLLRRKATFAGIDADTPDEVALTLGRLHREIKRLFALGYAPSNITTGSHDDPDDGDGADGDSDEAIPA